MDEITYTKNLNAKARAILVKRAGPPFLMMSAITLYTIYVMKNERARANTFYNRSKLFGTYKNPQY